MLMEKGLSSAEAKKRLLEFGRNDLSEKTHRHGLGILISQFTSPLIVILIVAAGGQGTATSWMLHPHLAWAITKPIEPPHRE